MVMSSGCSPTVAPGIPTLETGTQNRLTGDERRTPRRAALFRVIVGEHQAFFGDAVDVRRAVAHQAERVGTDVGLTDVVAEDNEDVRLLAVRRRRLRLRNANRIAGRDGRSRGECRAA
jgi:hypothetical protein